MKNYLLFFALVLCLGFAVAVTSGCLGGMSDLEAFRMSAEPFRK